MKEKLQQYAFIAEIVSAVAIVLSLIFVGLQVRLGAEETASNTEAMRSQVRESMLNADLNILSNAYDHPFLIDYEDTVEGKDHDTLNRIRAYAYSMARTRENYRIQHRNGVLDTDTYQS